MASHNNKNQKSSDVRKLRPSPLRVEIVKKEHNDSNSSVKEPSTPLSSEHYEYSTYCTRYNWIVNKESSNYFDFNIIKNILYLYHKCLFNKNLESPINYVSDLPSKNYTIIQMLQKEIETDRQLADSILFSSLWNGTTKDSWILLDYLYSLRQKIQQSELMVSQLCIACSLSNQVIIM